MIRAFVIFLALALALASEAHATRYALLIGANEGPPDLPVLQYAERDATRMADVLQRLGGVAPENIVVLRSPLAADVDRALASLRARMDPAVENLLTFYYSGHADRAQFHLSHSTYPYGDLKRALRAMPVELTIVLVDACRAGGLITAKGARVFAAAIDPAKPDQDDSPKVEGMAILTSSSVDEDAQESDRLGGGVFTHQLLSGLQGAADGNGDGVITLMELQSHAYAQTLGFTSTTEVVQHPAFAFDLQGHADPPLTTLDLASRGALVFADAGHYVVLEQSGQRTLVSELEARADANLALRPGTYRVRRLTRDAAFEGEVAVVSGTRTVLDADALTLIPFRHAIRKGYGLSHRVAWSLGVAADASGFAKTTDVLFGAAVTGQLDLAAASVQLRVRYAGGSAATRFVEFDQSLLGADVSVWHLFDVGRRLGVGFGVRLGADWLHQSFEAYGDAPSVDSTVGRLGSFARAELGLGGVVALTLDVGAEVYLVAKEDPDGRAAGFSNSITPVASLGAMFRL